MRNTSERRWHFMVNVLGASGLVTMAHRSRLYGRCGIRWDEGAVVHDGCWVFSSLLHIGHDALVNVGVVIDNKAPVVIGPEADIAPGAMLLTSDHLLQRSPGARRCGPFAPEPVTIGARSWIGARAMVMPGVTVAEGCVVGAGAVVTADTAADGLYAGVPARRLRDIG